MGECKRTGCPFYSNAIEMCELGNRYCTDDEYDVNLMLYAAETTSEGV